MSAAVTQSREDVMCRWIVDTHDAHVMPPSVRCTVLNDGVTGEGATTGGMRTGMACAGTDGDPDWEGREAPRLLMLPSSRALAVPAAASLCARASNGVTRLSLMLACVVCSVCSRARRGR